jgi:hypothetical protein
LFGLLLFRIPSRIRSSQWHLTWRLLLSSYTLKAVSISAFGTASLFQ